VGRDISCVIRTPAWAATGANLGSVLVRASPQRSSRATRLRAVSFTYTDVDSGEDPADAVRWQERVDEWPQIKAYKRRIGELLAGAQAVVDVGCGPGIDVLAIGSSRCIGVDRSMAMCATAHYRAPRCARPMLLACPSPTVRSTAPSPIGSSSTCPFRCKLSASSSVW
jgi:hypothetical protein